MINGKMLNWFGAIYIVQAMFWALFWSGSMSAIEIFCYATGLDEDRKLFDWTGKAWSRVNMQVGGCAPSVVTGLEHLPKEGEACLIVANHASWFDIPLMGQLISSTYKFVAAEALKDLPLVGQQLRGGKHILIDRANRRSQLKSFKESIAYLEKGVSVMAFPEGTRSRTGQIMEFKGGVFAMATKANVPIIPISIVGAYETYPSEALLPLAPNGKNIQVHIHPRIELKGRSEDELEMLTRKAIISKLPPEYIPKPVPDSGPNVEPHVSTDATAGLPPTSAAAVSTSAPT